MCITNSFFADDEHILNPSLDDLAEVSWLTNYEQFNWITFKNPSLLKCSIQIIEEEMEMNLNVKKSELRLSPELLMIDDDKRDRESHSSLLRVDWLDKLERGSSSFNFNFLLPLILYCASFITSSHAFYCANDHSPLSHSIKFISSGLVVKLPDNCWNWSWTLPLMLSVLSIQEHSPRFPMSRKDYLN